MSDIEKVHLSDRPPTQPGEDLTTEASQTPVASASWLGPLPPPGVLRSFDEVLPGSAERILVMAEKQADHRMLMEKTIVRGDSSRSNLGLVAGFVLSVMVILGGFYLIYNGHDVAGSVLIGLNLVGLAAVFVYGSSSRRLPPQEVAEVAEENTLLHSE